MLTWKDVNYYVSVKDKPREPGAELSEIDKENLEKGLPRQTLIQNGKKNFKQILFN